MVLCIGYAPSHHIETVRADLGHQQPVAAFNQSFGDLRNLLRSLARAVYNLREAASQLPVVVDLGIAQLLVGQVGQPGQGVLDADIPRLDFLQQQLQPFGVDITPPVRM